MSPTVIPSFSASRNSNIRSPSLRSAFVCLLVGTLIQTRQLTDHLSNRVHLAVGGSLLPLAHLSLGQLRVNQTRRQDHALRRRVVILQLPQLVNLRAAQRADANRSDTWYVYGVFW